MATKLGRKELPSGLSPGGFNYMGRPAKEQGDFGPEVGLADCACVNQFGESNNSKYYHGGVVQSSDGRWWVYLEWGRIFSGKSWNGNFKGQDFQFVQCSGEDEARSFFAKQLASKNTKRLERKTLGGVEVWAGKAGKDGYIVQSLATRERGLPDAYNIKDDSGVAPKAPASTPTKKVVSTKSFHPEEIKLAQDLVGGVQTYTRALSQASGIVPTLSAIRQVRDQLIPAALTRCGSVGNDINRQVQDRDLQDISKMVFALVPRYIPRGGLSPEAAILNTGNVFSLQQDLDAFENALSNEDFSVTQESSVPDVDPGALLNASLTWLDPRSELGAWVVNTFRSMTRNRHGDIRGRKLVVSNVFSIERPDRDAQYLSAARAVANLRNGRDFGHVMAGLQPSERRDLVGDEAKLVKEANVFIGIHGTRGVNIAPILRTHLRMPKSLSGVHITGAAFGHGIYWATDLGKSYGYTGHSNRWGSSGGNIRGRGFFMLLADVVGGKFHYPGSAWSINTDKCPGGCDTVYAHPSRVSSLANDEHVIFNPAHCRLRYLVEGEFR